MIQVFTRILKDKKNSLVAYVIAAAAFVEMYLALFPALKSQADQLNKLLEAYPKSFMSAFGFESGTAAFFSRVENYMSTEFFSFLWPILTVIMLISFANAMISNEVEKGTIELTLAQPISRIKLFFSRYFAGLVYFFIFSGASVFSIVLFSSLHGFEYKIQNFFTIWFVGYLFGIAVFSVAVFFSALLSDKGKAIFSTSGILLLMYVLNIISGLKENLKNLQYFSFFHYFNAPTLLGKNVIVQWTLPVFVGVIVIFTGAALIWFNRRDITT